MYGTERNSAGDHLGLLDRALGVDCWRHSHTHRLYLWTRSSRQGGDKNFMLIVIIIMFIISDLWFSFLGSVSPSDLLHICGYWLPHPPHWHHLQCQAALWYSGHHHHHWNPKRSKGEKCSRNHWNFKQLQGWIEFLCADVSPLTSITKQPFCWISQARLLKLEAKTKILEFHFQKENLSTHF